MTLNRKPNNTEPNLGRRIRPASLARSPRAPTQLRRACAGVWGLGVQGLQRDLVQEGFRVSRKNILVNNPTNYINVNSFTAIY